MRSGSVAPRAFLADIETAWQRRISLAHRETCMGVLAEYEGGKHAYFWIYDKLGGFRVADSRHSVRRRCGGGTYAVDDVHGAQ